MINKLLMVLVRILEFPFRSKVHFGIVFMCLLLFLSFNKPLINIILLVIGGGIYITFQSLFWNKNIPWKHIAWWMLIYLICIFPIFIDMIKSYDYLLTVKQNFGKSAIATIKNNSFYSVLFSLLMAGYIDFIFSNAVKRIKIHLIVIIVLLVIICLAFYGNLYIPGNIETMKMEANLETMYFVLQVSLGPYIAILTLYLKKLSASVISK